MGLEAGTEVVQLLRSLLEHLLERNGCRSWGRGCEVGDDSLRARRMPPDDLEGTSGELRHRCAGIVENSDVEDPESGWLGQRTPGLDPNIGEGGGRGEESDSIDGEGERQLAPFEHQSQGHLERTVRHRGVKNKARLPGWLGRCRVLQPGQGGAGPRPPLVNRSQGRAVSDAQGVEAAVEGIPPRLRESDPSGLQVQRPDGADAGSGSTFDMCRRGSAGSGGSDLESPGTCSPGMFVGSEQELRSPFLVELQGLLEDDLGKLESRRTDLF